MRSRSTTLGRDAHARRTRTGARRPVRRPLAGVAGLSDTGLRRAVNQDAYLASERLVAVADGVGGGPAGEVAARVAIDALSAGGDPARASAAVYDAAQGDPRRRGMATTLTAGRFTGAGFEVAHAGDSRAYRLRGGGIELLTDDHAVVPQMVARGILVRDRAATHPLRNMLTRALGRDRDTDFDTLVADAQSGDVFLLCTDGLTKMVDEPAIAAIVATADSLDGAALALVRAANAAGGHDNVTVVLAAA